MYSKLLIISFVSMVYAKTNAQIDSNISSVKEVIKSSDKFFGENLALNKNIIGLSAAIIMNDSVVWSNGFGYADKVNKVPMTTSTVVNIGSITKTFTSLSVMQLHQKGLLNINKPLISYLTDFRPKTNNFHLKDITIKSILTHTSGIQSDFWKNSDLETGKYTDILSYINDTYITYPPGMVGLYSNAGYNILGSLVKAVSKQDYADYVQQNIFFPLKMNHSGFAINHLKNRTKIYLGGSEVKEYELRDIASGGIYTSINDFPKYAIDLIKAYNGETSVLIDSSTIHEMFSLQNKTVQIESNKKGLGWFMFKNDTNFAVYHAGSAGFAQAKLLLIPKSKFAVIVMTNSAEGGPIAEEFCFNFLKKYQLNISDLFPTPITGNIHAASKPIKLSPSCLKKHLGNYAESEGYIKVVLEKDRLKLIDGEKQYFLTPLTKNEFLPFEIFPNDSLVEKSNKRFVFKKVNKETFLFQRIGSREYESGLKLKNINHQDWKNVTGKYKHFGYQMLIGDTKFKEVEIYITDDEVLMMKLTTFGGVRSIPLRVLASNYAVTCGINAGFGGFNVRFYKENNQQLVDFAGITFRKGK